MSNKINLVSIDLGFLYTKAIINNQKYMIKSIIGNGTTLNFRDFNMNTEKKDDISCMVDGRDYFVSDLAISQSDTVFHSLKGDRFESTTAKVLINSIMALGLGNGNFNGVIVSGLPVSHFSNYKRSLKSMCMEGIHKYDVIQDGKQYISGHIGFKDGKFLPQPFGAAMDILLDDKGELSDIKLASQTVAVIDIGFGTTDVYVLNELSTIEKLTFSTPTAMNHAYKLLSNELSEENLPLYEINNLIKKKKYKSYDITSNIEWSFECTAEQLSSEIINKWQQKMHQIDHIYVAGGGGICLFRYIKKNLGDIKLIPDSQWSIVNGYNKWGKRCWCKNG